jgi:hypothetical protein
MKIESMDEKYVFFANLSYFMIFGKLELQRSVIHSWPPQ